MLFDITPKNDVKDLFGREKEINLLKNSIKEPLTVIYGIRRTGKTSLLKSVLNSLETPYIIIDIRELFNESGSIRENEVSIKILNELKKNVKLLQKLKFLFNDMISRINGIEINNFKMNIDTSRRYKLNNILELINEIAFKTSSIFILAVDEAQYLKYGGRRYSNILAWAYDSLKNLHIIITGSEIGMLDDFIDIENPESPLFGRMLNDIKLDHFDRETSYNFLKKGFRELKIRVNDNDINSAVNTLDGIPGWLTYYGYNRAIRKIDNSGSINNVIEYSRKLIDLEIGKLISNSRDRYIAILEAIASGLNNWSSIKSYVAAKTGYISGTILNNHLTKLLKYGFIKKSEDKYSFEDPLLKLRFMSGGK